VLGRIRKVPIALVMCPDREASLACTHKVGVVLGNVQVVNYRFFSIIENLGNPGAASAVSFRAVKAD